MVQQCSFCPERGQNVLPCRECQGRIQMCRKCIKFQRNKNMICFNGELLFQCVRCYDVEQHTLERSVNCSSKLIREDPDVFEQVRHKNCVHCSRPINPCYDCAGPLDEHGKQMSIGDDIPRCSLCLNYYCYECDYLLVCKEETCVYSPTCFDCVSDFSGLGWCGLCDMAVCLEHYPLSDHHCAMSPPKKKKKKNTIDVKSKRHKKDPVDKDQFFPPFFLDGLNECKNVDMNEPKPTSNEINASTTIHVMGKTSAKAHDVIHAMGKPSDKMIDTEKSNVSKLTDTPITTTTASVYDEERKQTETQPRKNKPKSKKGKKGKVKYVHPHVNQRIDFMPSHSYSTRLQSRPTT